MHYHTFALTLLLLVKPVSVENRPAEGAASVKGDMVIWLLMIFYFLLGISLQLASVYIPSSFVVKVLKVLGSPCKNAELMQTCM